ncbi:MAG TPA: hypothetical protein VJ835_03420 [Fimbriimonadaceae bacterium]|nr:hypothetical protein [Fimbriimonadaceae bacterium]
MRALQHSASFRDPSGFVFSRGNDLLRQVDAQFADSYTQLKQSGLIEELIRDGLVTAFEEVDLNFAASDSAFAVLRADRVPFISYPYEWCFGQLKAAALLTLEIQRRAVERGFALKDATAYNVQFVGSKPIFIDLLSFEPAPEGPWIAYRQFCRHFLAPLALMSWVDPRLGQLLKSNLDGLPLDLAAKTLPMRARLNTGLAAHLVLHSRADQKQGVSGQARKVTKSNHLALLDSLRRTIESLKVNTDETVWENYYSDTNYSERSEKAKENLVEAYLQKIPEKGFCWDLGANTGRFSELAFKLGFPTIAFDLDVGATEKSFQSKPNYLPLVLDIANPSPALGWGLQERESLLQRGPAKVVLALALVHHLSISNNVPLPWVAEFLSNLGDWLIIEFIDLEDSQVQRLFHARNNKVHMYNGEAFLAAIDQYFTIDASSPIDDSLRTLYLLKRRD